MERLSDEDPAVADTVLVSMEKFVRNEGFLKAIMQSEELINCLGRELNRAVEYFSQLPNKAAVADQQVST